MSNDREDRNVMVNFLAGMGLGALIGAAAALLLAPKSGEETREDLKHAVDDIRAKADKVIHDLSESGEELVKKSKEVLESTKLKMQQAIEAGKQAAARKREEVAETGAAEETAEA